MENEEDASQVIVIKRDNFEEKTGTKERYGGYLDIVKRSAVGLNFGNNIDTVMLQYTFKGSSANTTFNVRILG